VGLGVGVEVAESAQAVFCPQYGKDVVVCGTILEAVIPPNVHTSEVGTPSSARAATVVASTSVGTTHEVRLGENLFLSDGNVRAKLARRRDVSRQTRRDSGAC